MDHERPATIKMHNKPNFNTTSSAQKTINQSRPKDESTNNQSSIIDNQLKGPNLHKSSHKCLRNIDLQKYLNPALLVSKNTYGPGDKKNAKQTQFTYTQYNIRNPDLSTTSPAESSKVEGTIYETKTNPISKLQESRIEHQESSIKNRVSRYKK